MTSPTRKAVLIDVDGTLLDSNDAHANAWVEVLTRAGYDAPYDRIRSLIGKGGDKLLEEAVGVDEDSDEGERLSEERVAVVRDRFLKSLRPTTGARALLERLRDDGVQLIVATSATGEELRGLLKQADVADLIDASSTSQDADASKPDPDIVVAALRKAGVDAKDAVMLGDTPYDIESARKAGVDTIVFRCGGFWDDAALGDAVAIYDDPGSLLNALEGSPLYRRAEAG